MRALACIVLAALAMPLLAAEAPADPAEVVRSLYAAQAADNGPFFQHKDRALVDRWFAPDLANLIWKDANGPEGDVGVIDGDPLHDAQDMEITNEKIGDAVINGEIATVDATFENFGEKKSITFILQTQPDGTWRIVNVDWGHDTLYGVLDKGLDGE